MRKLFRSGGPVVLRTRGNDGMFSTVPVLAIALVAAAYMLAAALDHTAEMELQAMQDGARLAAFEDGRRQGHDEMLAALNERNAVTALPADGCRNLGLVNASKGAQP